MASLFDAELTEWRAAQTSESSLVEYVVHRTASVSPMTALPAPTAATVALGHTVPETATVLERPRHRRRTVLVVAAALVLLLVGGWLAVRSGEEDRTTPSPASLGPAASMAPSFAPISPQPVAPTLVPSLATDGPNTPPPAAVTVGSEPTPAPTPPSPPHSTRPAHRPAPTTQRPTPGSPGEPAPPPPTSRALDPDEIIR
jgi:hypothetical protein